MGPLRQRVRSVRSAVSTLLAGAILAAGLAHGVDAGAACNAAAMCSGNPCTITGNHNLDDDCTLDFSGKTVTIAKNAVVRTANDNYFTIYAHTLVHKGLMRARAGGITIEVTGDFITLNDGGQKGVIDLKAPDPDDFSGDLEILAGGAISIGSMLTVAGDSGSIDIEACDLELNGTIDASGGETALRYRTDFAAVGGTIVADENEISCREVGASNCSALPSGLNCSLGSGLCTSGAVTLSPPADFGPDPDLDQCPCESSADCNDQNPCTIDHCSAGTCTYDEVICTEQDGNVCTVPLCDIFVGCSEWPVYHPQPCNDGNACTINDVCGLGTGVCGGECDTEKECAVGCENASCVDGPGGCACQIVNKVWVLIDDIPVEVTVGP